MYYIVLIGCPALFTKQLRLKQDEGAGLNYHWLNKWMSVNLLGFMADVLAVGHVLG